MAQEVWSNHYDVVVNYYSGCLTEVHGGPSRLAASVMVAAVLITSLAGPTQNAVASSVTAELQPQGNLSITAPATANLGSVAIGGTISADLGTVTASSQGTLTWTASVTSTVFTTTSSTIANSNVSYWSGPATATTGPGTFTPGQSTAAQAVSLSTSRVAFTRTGSNGNNSASWTPTLVINVPANAFAGTYQGTITHSIA